MLPDVMFRSEIQDRELSGKDLSEESNKYIRRSSERDVAECILTFVVHKRHIFEPDSTAADNKSMLDQHQ